MIRGRSRGTIKTQDARRQLIRALDLEELVAVKQPSKAVRAFDQSFGQCLAARRHKKECRKLKPLKTITARFLAYNVDAISLEVLEQFKWTEVQPIWDMIEEEMLNSLEVFAKFATAFPRDIDAHKKLHVAVKDLSSALAKVIAVSLRMKGSLSRPLSWTLHLDLSHMTLPEETLLQLGSIPGLAVLKIDDSRVTANTISHWSRAHSAGGFADLTLLDIRSNPIANVAETIVKLLEWSKLELLRCDATKAWRFKNEVEEVELLSMWTKSLAMSSPVLELKTHLGSLADHRPMPAPKGQVIINAKRWRESKRTAGTSTSATLAQTTIGARKKQKFKMHIGQDALWEQIL